MNVLDGFGIRRKALQLTLDNILVLQETTQKGKL